jgi:hypothetical protein
MILRNALFALVLGTFVLAGCSSAEADDRNVVYMTPTCGCCQLWVDHLEENGIDVEVRLVDNLTPAKMDNSIPYDLGSCHTAVIGGYVVEGHVPADVIKRMLNEKPDIKGIAVPGMPIGSPGMEGPNPEPYDILAFRADGSRAVYASR